VENQLIGKPLLRFKHILDCLELIFPVSIDASYCLGSFTLDNHIPFNIVLVEPEIPPNTGNIARLCGATGTVLHLVGKLGFNTDDRTLKRAGLDYWSEVDIRYWTDLETLKQTVPQGRFIYASKKVQKSYVELTYLPGDYLVFGKETKGLPEELIAANPETSVRIPMMGKVRSLNLSTSAGIVLYEALRQTGRLC
jgi:tRNA (cytidine/uridine-2'-O-)-methyltransferase